MKKRILAVCLALCLALTLLPGTTIAAEVDSGTCGENVTWSLDDVGTLTITGTGAMGNFDSAYVVPWRGYRPSISKVIIVDGVTRIGNYAFVTCSGFADITIPESVTSVGLSAFLSCSGFSDVYYSGTKAQWGLVSVEATGNAPLFGATIHCSDGDILPESAGRDYTYKITSPFGTLDSETGYYVVTSSTLNTSLTIDAPLDKLVNVYLDGTKYTVDDGYYTASENTGTVIEINRNLFSPLNFSYGTHTLMVEFQPTGNSTAPHRVSQNFTHLPDGFTNLGTGYVGVPFYWPLDDFYPNGVIGGGQGMSLPDGLMFDKTGGTVVGTPQKTGTWYFALGYEGEPDYDYSYFKLTIKEEPEVEYTALPSGVKYVPYSCRAEEESFTSTPNDPGWELLHYELEGTLPGGLSLDPKTAVISGVPMAAGTWTFTVKRILPHPEEGNGADSVLELPWSLTILNNTDAAVKEPNDYPIIEPVGRPSGSDPNHFYKTEYSEERLVIDGPYSDFFRLRIDGTELHEPQDYTSEEGSTVITIRSQTFQKFGEGTHTISAEYREGGKPDGALKKVAQNYTLTISRPSSGGSSGGGSSGSSRPSSSNTKKPEQKPQQPTSKPGLPFTDVSPSDWFYNDVVWAYENGVMLGVSDTLFAPQRKVSQATIVTVLARLAKVDLTRFEEEEESGIQTGQQFTPAAIWAKRAGLLPKEGVFTGDETTTRNQMAVMLVRYLRSMGKDTTLPTQPAAFADAEDMTQEGNDAFQVLYQQSIFKGVGGLNMNAAGSTTRAHFVALIHRIYKAAMNQE